jgi:hypothetical protein
MTRKRHGYADRRLGPPNHLGGELHRRLDFVVLRLEHDFILAASALDVAGVELHPPPRRGFPFDVNRIRRGFGAGFPVVAN